MDFARQQRDPTKHMIGIAFVVLVHVVVIYALLTGLGKSIIEVIKKPLTATIIEEIKLPPPPPPPPPKKIIEPPKQQIVQPYVPPPDIPVPVQAEPVISAVTATPPTEPHVIAPPVVAPPAPPKPAVRRGVSRVSGEDPTYPRAAIKAGIDNGRVVARINIDEKGNVTEVIIVSADPPRHFDRAVIDALMSWKFRAEGEKYVAEVELNFSLKD
jgi:periplasmic protein TonB